MYLHPVPCVVYQNSLVSQERFFPVGRENSAAFRQPGESQASRLHLLELYTATRVGAENVTGPQGRETMTRTIQLLSLLIMLCLLVTAPTIAAPQQPEPEEPTQTEGEDASAEDEEAEGRGGRDGDEPDGIQPYEIGESRC